MNLINFSLISLVYSKIHVHTYLFRRSSVCCTFASSHVTSSHSGQLFPSKLFFCPSNVSFLSYLGLHAVYSISLPSLFVLLLLLLVCFVVISLSLHCLFHIFVSIHLYIFYPSFSCLCFISLPFHCFIRTKIRKREATNRK